MHYANGREAKLGDVVRGKGSNIKHEIVGIVVGLTPGTDTCNIRVSTVGKSPSYMPVTKSVVWFDGDKVMVSDSQVEAQSITEYGATKDFVALDIQTGEVLV